MKFKLLIIFFIGILLLTGCGKKECSKWVTKTSGAYKDCSKTKGSNEYTIVNYLIIK